MTEPRAQRRLAAILAADVVGYSRLMEANEERTMAALQHHRREFFDPIMAKHGGRIFKVMGDGFLVEFGSVVNAAHCAVEIQQGMALRNQGVPDDQSITFRIGVNLGDVIVEGTDLHGDGVNVAARLEGLADPGGICLSASVHDQVKRRMDVQFDDMGPQTLKNIAEPLRVFRVRMQVRVPAALALPDKPSIAVLPFVNMSTDPEYEFFVDGLTEDLITDLSRNPGLFVIARNSSFAYKGKSVDVRRIARELGVRFLLEGSARRAGGRVRINVQLIDSIGGGHLWAERFDRQLEDIFDLQDEVTACILEAMVGQLVAPPPRKRTNSVQAYDHFLRGQVLFDSFMGSADAMRESMVLLEKAIDLDPGYAAAYASLAGVRALAWVHCNIPVDTRRGTVLEIAEKAVSLDPNDSTCHSTLAMCLDLAGQWEASRTEYNRAIELDPSNDEALILFADHLIFAGQPEQAEAPTLRAMRLNPLPTPWHYMALGKVQYALRRYADAVKTLRHPSTYRTSSRRYLAASLAQSGSIEEAGQEAGLFIASNPSFTISHWVGSMQYQDSPSMAHFVEGFRLAGLPE